MQLRIRNLDLRFMNKAELLNRTKQFALDIIELVNRLPANQTNKVLSSQLLRAGTSVGANYRAAVRAKSKADFIYKIKIVEEEADESVYWLELINKTNKNFEVYINSLLKEADELTPFLHRLARLQK